MIEAAGAVVVRWARVDDVTDDLAERLSEQERSRLPSMARGSTGSGSWPPTSSFGRSSPT